MTAAGNPRLYLIQPMFPPSFWGMDLCRDLSGYAANFPPLSLMTLAALTPEAVEVVICDEHVSPADLTTDFEVVGITGYLLQKQRVFDLADHYRSAGKLVVIGGPIANLIPEQCRPHCDVLFEGESEYTWPKFINDLLTGQVEDNYCEKGSVSLKDSPVPRIDLIDGKRYAQGIVQTARGCPFNCEFCDITVMFGRAVRTKSVDQVITEVRAWHQAGMSAVFFADDNFAGNRKHAREVLNALIEFNQSLAYPLVYHSQISVDITQDDEFLNLMKEANFHAVFVGIETPRKESLVETNKMQNARINLPEAIKKFQSKGLFVFAGMIVGFDNDDETIFDEMYDFLQSVNIPLAMVGLLQALPKTALFARLSKAGRLREQAQAGNNTGFSTNINPLNMSYEALCSGYAELCKRLYSYDSFAKRLIGSLSAFQGYTHRAHKITMDTFWAGMRVLRYYLITLDNRRRSFFLSVVAQTLRICPRALVPVLWYLGMYKHLRQFVFDRAEA